MLNAQYFLKNNVLINTIVCVSLFFFNTALAQKTRENNAYVSTLSNWQKVLTQHVDLQGRIDFQGVAEDRDNLNKFIEAIESVSPQTHPELFVTPEEVMSYHINAYNALAMHGVLERNIPKGFKSFFKRASFFKFRSIKIGGKKTNLYDYENKVIRPLNEPRSHFALNCMVRDCPRLPKRAFTPDNLEKMLHEASIEFFNKDKHLVVNHDKKSIKVSAILKFYTKDFVPSAKANDLLPYINQYRIEKIDPDYKVKYLKYDWTVNKQS